MFEFKVRQYYYTRPWVARILGPDKHYGLEREFVRPTERVYSRSGATGTMTYLLPDGVYQVGGGKQITRDHGSFFRIRGRKNEPLRGPKSALDALGYGTTGETTSTAAVVSDAAETV